MLERLKSKNVKKPLAVVACSLAGIAFTGCGDEDEKWKIEVVCPENTHLVLEDMQQSEGFGDDLISVTCRTPNGTYQKPLGANPLNEDLGFGVFVDNITGVEKDQIDIDVKTMTDVLLGQRGNPHVSIESPAERGEISPELHLILHDLDFIDNVKISD